MSYTQHNQELERINDTHEQQVKQLDVGDKHNVVVWLERVTTATLNFVSNLFMYCIFMLFIMHGCLLRLTLLTCSAIANPLTLLKKVKIIICETFHFDMQGKITHKE